MVTFLLQYQWSMFIHSSIENWPHANPHCVNYYYYRILTYHRPHMERKIQIAFRKTRYKNPFGSFERFVAWAINVCQHLFKRTVSALFNSGEKPNFVTKALKIEIDKTSIFPTYDGIRFALHAKLLNFMFSNSKQIKI